MPVFTPPSYNISDSVDSASGLRIHNREYDEAIDVSEDGHEVDTPESSTKDEKSGEETTPQFSYSPPLGESLNSSSNYEDGMQHERFLNMGLDDTHEDGVGLESGNEDDEDEDEDEDDEEEVFSVPEYDPQEFEHLAHTEDLKDLFVFITAFKPHELDLETQLRPFIPDHLPSIGEIDPFIKIPRPDGKPDNLGLTILDEPGPTQSDPTVVDLTLRYQSKRGDSAKPQTVGVIEHAERNSKAVDNWIANVQQLHQSKPPPTVVHNKPMPDIEQLMQVWPQEFEDLLDQVELPGPEVALSLEEYARMMCALLDIPVHGNGTGSVVESLYTALTLYSAFRTNEHFKEENIADM